MALRSIVRQHALRCAARRYPDHSLTTMSDTENGTPTGISLNHNRVVVAGGTSGIGFAVAEAGARAGSRRIDLIGRG
jgi:hypothetical protein